jgi:hypothetical protein
MMPRNLLHLVPALSIGALLMAIGGLTPSLYWVTLVGAFLVQFAVIILYREVSRQRRELEELRRPPATSDSHA